MSLSPRELGSPPLYLKSTDMKLAIAEDTNFSRRPISLAVVESASLTRDRTQVIVVRLWRGSSVSIGWRFPGRRSRDEGQPNGEQESGRRRRRWQRRRRRRLEATRPTDHYKGETIGDLEDGLLVDPEAHQAHQGAVGERDRPAHESHTGGKSLSLSLSFSSHSHWNFSCLSIILHPLIFPLRRKVSSRN